MTVNLRHERRRRGLSIADLAKQIGVTADVLSYAEKGGRPQPANALKIAEFFRVDVVEQWPEPVPADVVETSA